MSISHTPLSTLYSLFSALGSLLLNFFLPVRCALCNKPLPDNDSLLCFHCAMHLPYYRCDDFVDNELARIFWKRLPMVKATAMMYYMIENQSTKLITLPKYNRRDDISLALGSMLATRFAGRHFYDDIDVVVPMPVADVRYFSRGMNQVELTTGAMVRALRKQGIAIKHCPNAVRRVRFEQSQTKHNRSERVRNIDAKMFKVVHAEQLAGKHILIVDDVITTGASVTALGEAIVSSAQNVRISVLAISRTMVG